MGRWHDSNSTILSVSFPRGSLLSNRITTRWLRYYRMDLQLGLGETAVISRPSVGTWRGSSRHNTSEEIFNYTTVGNSANVNCSEDSEKCLYKEGERLAVAFLALFWILQNRFNKFFFSFFLRRTASRKAITTRPEAFRVPPANSSEINNKVKRQTERVRGISSAR